MNSKCKMQNAKPVTFVLSFVLISLLSIGMFIPVSVKAEAPDRDATELPWRMLLTV